MFLSFLGASGSTLHASGALLLFMHIIDSVICAVSCSQNMYPIWLLTIVCIGLVVPNLCKYLTLGAVEATQVTLCAV